MLVALINLTFINYLSTVICEMMHFYIEWCRSRSQGHEPNLSISKQIYRYPNLLKTGSLDAMKGRRTQHPSYPQQLEVPYIPQPDYTPLPARRTLISTRHKASPPVSTRNPEVIKSSSEFRAHDWNTALLKQLSLEAQKRQNELVIPSFPFSF